MLTKDHLAQGIYYFKFLSFSLHANLAARFTIEVLVVISDKGLFTLNEKAALSIAASCNTLERNTRISIVPLTLSDIAGVATKCHW